MSQESDLQRFIDAQSVVFTSVCQELRNGRKLTHWMWFIFPQLVGLGYSPMAQRYGIRSLAEARAYLAHETLGPRLRETTSIVTALVGRSAFDIFGSPDDRKFQSCLTLFARADPAGEVFKAALAKYYDAQPDQRTLDKLTEHSG